jgi:hypothetical protein
MSLDLLTIEEVAIDFCRQQLRAKTGEQLLIDNLKKSYYYNININIHVIYYYYNK